MKNMINKFLNIFSKIVRWKVIFFLLGIFVLSLLPIHVVPDFFNMGELDKKKEAIFTLITLTIGFASLILTVLLVIYNFHFKYARRQTLEFILDNNWLTLIFSFFFGIVLFLGLSFLSIGSGLFNDLTLMYLSYTLTFLFILSLFPLAILSLDDSVALNRIYKILGNIRESDLGYIHSPLPKVNFEDTIEKNPIIILKDISVNAILDKDWLLPQTVLKRLYVKLIQPIDSNSSDSQIIINLSVWVFFCNHLKKEVVKNDDNISGEMLLSLNITAHSHLAKNRVIHIRGNGIDSFLIDYFRLIVEYNVFFDTQSYFAINATNILKDHFGSIKYSDEELPTDEYRYSLVDSKAYNYELTAQSNYWFYITHELPDVLFNTIENAIDIKCKNVYDNFSWNAQSLLDFIFNANNLTSFQKKDAIKEILYRADRTSRYAIDNGIYDGVDVVSNVQVTTWIKKDTKLGMELFSNFFNRIKLLHSKGGLSSLYIDNFFMIARVLARQIEYNEVVDSILSLGITIFNEIDTTIQTKKDLVYELRWFKDDYLEKIESLAPINEKYRAALVQVIYYV